MKTEFELYFVYMSVPSCGTRPGVAIIFKIFYFCKHFLSDVCDLFSNLMCQVSYVPEIVTL